MRRSLSGISNGLIAVLLLAGVVPCRAQTLVNGKAVYTLVHGSTLTDDCPMCDRVTVPLPMRGTFELRLLSQGPLFMNYAVESLAFTASQPGGRSYRVSGHGTYRIGGEIASQQDLVLEAMIDDGTTNSLCEFTNISSQVSRLWPMLQAGVSQTNGTLLRQYSLTLDAAPFREIWFSTVSNFVASGWNASSNAISGGDLLAGSGRVVKRNSQLTAQLGVQPIVPDLGLKDVDILTGGEIVFSIEQNVFSKTLGQLTPQDLLSDRGRIVRHANPDLMQSFQPKDPLPAFVGLEAVQVTDAGEVYFSVQNAFGSAKLGMTLQPGDLLSEKGTVVRSGQQLRAAFGPQNPTNDVGLKAVYLWPSGEVWFSTRDGFTNTNGTHFGPGDLLSDQGYLVYSNAELLSAFSPADAPADLGLDALFIVSDVVPLTSSTSLGVPQIASGPSGNVTVQRKPGARAFQLESATNVLGPFTPSGPITTDHVFIDAGATTNQPQRFYRLHQW